jgi:hypothetical protein
MSVAWIEKPADFRENWRNRSGPFSPIFGKAASQNFFLKKSKKLK